MFSLTNSTKQLKDIMPIVHNLSENEGKEHFPTHFMTRITLMPKQDKYYQKRREKLQINNPHENICKILAN